MFYFSGKNSDSTNGGRPPYFEYKNCIPYLQGSSQVLQTWSICNNSCVDNNWKPIRDACVANAGSVDFNYSFIRPGTTGFNNELMVNCSYGGEAILGGQSNPFEANIASYIGSYKTLSMDEVIVYSTGTQGVGAGDTPAGFARVYQSAYLRNQENSIYIENISGGIVTGITGRTGCFGGSVSQKGDIVAVGAFLEGYNPTLLSYNNYDPTGAFGRVYIYNSSGELLNTIYPPQGSPPNPNAALGFGNSVTLINEDILIIGAPFTSGYKEYDYIWEGAPVGTPGWVEKVGAAYIYTTGGQLLHEITGVTGSLGASTEGLKNRYLGWQTHATQNSVVAAGPGLVLASPQTTSNKSFQVYTTGGIYQNAIGQNYDSSMLGSSPLYEALAWASCSNSEKIFFSNFETSTVFGKFTNYMVALNEDGSYNSKITIPQNASIYGATAADASDKYLLLGDPFGRSLNGSLYIMETGDLFLKEIDPPSDVPFFGFQVAANNDTYTAMNASGVFSYYLSGSIPFESFTGEIGSAFENWKGLLEHTFTGVNINFVNLGLETGRDIASNSSQEKYPLDSHIGNTRIGMESGIKAAWSYCPGGTMNVSGELGGDVHLDRWAAWRRDTTPLSEAPSGSYSIEYAMTQAIGGALGLGPDTSSGSIMYDSLEPELSFSGKFPNGLSGSIYDQNAVMGIYGI